MLRPYRPRLVLMLRLETQYLAALVSNTHCSVWNHQTGHLVWTRQIITRTSIPPVRASCLALSHPHLLVGCSHGRAELWDVEKDCLLRRLEHPLDSGLNM